MLFTPVFTLQLEVKVTAVKRAYNDNTVLFKSLESELEQSTRNELSDYLSNY